MKTKENNKNKEALFMIKALSLAKKGGCSTRPNPLVGSVIVKNDKIIGMGYHNCYGGCHAEVNSLRDAGKNARNADLYVNLEPCSHWGKTPPCVDSIIKAGISKVHFSMFDPNPLVSGKGANELKKRGIKTSFGLLESEARYLNREYITNIKEERPYMLLKQAQTLDGKIATYIGDSKWISSEKSRDIVHKIRAGSQAILVGINTILKDNPYLTSHGKGNNPIRIAVDKKLDIPIKSNFLKSDVKRIVVASNRSDLTKVEKLESMGVVVLKFKLNSNGKLNLINVIKYLYKIGIYQVLLESGGNLNSAFLEAGLIDEVVYFIAPKIVGGSEAVTSVEGKGVKYIKNSININKIKVERIDNDVMIRGILREI
ncbi:MAG: bifunctional diaminohydroxyphosphoribosylaminopyrimidine deaminase/5-amino-6-(5-phosphoribosylamino)uracil reductase RibD [bacterium]